MDGRPLTTDAVDRPVSRPTLDRWLADHGPLTEAEALLIALDTCARASRLPDVQLSAVFPSLATAGMARTIGGEWRWLPASGDAASVRPSDRDVIERVGAILFHSLAAEPLQYPPPSEDELRTTLRAVRPDLEARIVDVTVDAILSRRRPAESLAAFGARLRQLLVPAPHSEIPTRRAITLAAAALILVGVSSWAASGVGRERVQAHGLTPRETNAVDLGQESAQIYAFMDEHTAAYGTFNQIARIWASRVAFGDPRIRWLQVNEAWVRTLAGDRLTAEQHLHDVLPGLAAALGEGHPYVRTVRLDLAATLDARGESMAAHRLRNEAAATTRDLLHNGLDLTRLDPLPVAPGVLAHAAPARPEQEGFRQGVDGRFFAPLTTVQQWVAGRDGWRLHVVADGACEVIAPVGVDSRPVAVRVAHNADHAWRVRIDGTTGPIVDVPSSPTIALSIAGQASRQVAVAVGTTAPIVRDLETATLPPDPPYSLAFRSGEPAAGCAVVWLEITFPFQPR